MKVARLMQNQLHLDPLATSPYQALEMATARGAKALGLDGELGSLEVGRLADNSVFDLETPWPSVGHHPVSNLVHSARGLDATHVLVGGEFLIRNGCFTRFSEGESHETLAEARSGSEQVIGRTGVEHLVHEALDRA